MRRSYATLDVFTNTRFAGNPLAVVLDAVGLGTAEMQHIAREFNLSETVFVFPPADRAHRAALRIFTPGRELPFAGHPTVGTAVLLAGLEDHGESGEFVLEENIGPVRCRVRPAGHGAGRAEFDVPRLPGKEKDGVDGRAILKALGLTPADVDDGLPSERWSAGNPFAFVPMRGLDAMRRCRIDLAAFDNAFQGLDHPAAFVFCRETAEKGSHFHARMFAPSFGIIEDPATGSAAAAFAGYLAAYGKYADGQHSVRIEQGFEMGRPSLIELTIKMSAGRLAGASIGGQAVVVSEGVIEA